MRYSFDALVIIILFLMSINQLAAQTLGSEFSYQGELRQSGQVAEGAFDFEIRLFDSATDGVELAVSNVLDDVSVSGGLFNVLLDFGDLAFSGDQAWVQIEVRNGESNSAYTVLSPRQSVRPAPYALHAINVSMDAITSTQIANNAVGTSEISSNAVGSNEIATNAVGSSEIAQNAVGLSEINELQVQRRISQACNDGESIQSVAQNGSVVCVLASGPVANLTAHILDFSVESGYWPDMVFGLDGYPRISYFDAGLGDLKLAVCDDPYCNTAQIRTLDFNGITGSYTSMATPSDGRAVIAYYNQTQSNLMYARCDDPLCTSSTTTTLDNAGNVGQYTSIALRGDSVYISYYDVGNAQLKVLYCSQDLSCSNAMTIVADTAGDVGQYSSIMASPSSSRVFLAYYDASNSDLKGVDCTGFGNGSITCETPFVVDSAGATGLYAHGTLNAQGNIVIFYVSGTPGSSQDIRVMQCNSTSSISACSSHVLYQSNASCGGSCTPFVLDASLASNGDIYVRTQTGRVFICPGGRCESISRTIITGSSTGGGQEYGTALLIGSNGNPIFAGRIQSSRLGVRVCQNRFCSAISIP